MQHCRAYRYQPSMPRSWFSTRSNKNFISSRMTASLYSYQKIFPVQSNIKDLSIQFFVQSFLIRCNKTYNSHTLVLLNSSIWSSHLTFLRLFSANWTNEVVLLRLNVTDCSWTYIIQTYGNIQRNSIVYHLFQNLLCINCHVLYRLDIV